ncbi:MAG: hypothetical protein GY940_16385, partial [bacterium]|nr:hypothetical protein [bacterium]
GIVPVFVVLILFLFFPFFDLSPGINCDRSEWNCELPELRNDSFVPESSGVTIKINRNGEIRLLDPASYIEMSKLSILIEDEMKVNRRYFKVNVVADRNLEFGIIQEVLRAVETSGSNVVGLITKEDVPIMEFMWESNNE